MTLELDQTLPLQELPVVSYLTESFLTKLRQGFWFRRLTVCRAVPGRALLMSNAFEKSITITSDFHHFAFLWPSHRQMRLQLGFAWVTFTESRNATNCVQPRQLLFNEIIKEEKLSTWLFGGETKLNALNLHRQCFGKHSIEKMLSLVFLVETHYRQDFSL